MQIHEQIKEHRKKVGLTQEQVANYLGVSTPAVNKWERGSSFPDISLLPAFARLLKIDLNTLFSFNETLSEFEIKAFIAELVEIILKSNFIDAFKMAEDKIHKYPYSDDLLFNVVTVLDSSLTLSTLDTECKEKYKQQILTWYKQAAQSHDESIRTSAINMLVDKYIKNSDYDKASELIEQLPDTNIDKTSFQIDILIHQEKLDEAASLLEGKLLQDLEKIQSKLFKLITLETKTENREAALKIARIAQDMIPLFGLWNYGRIIPNLLVAIYQKDINNSISQLKIMLDEVQKNWNMSASPLFYRIAQKSLEDIGKKYFLPAFISELKNSNEYDFLRSNNDYEKILIEYQKIIDM